MRDLLTILPLAVVMVAGPQIISSVFFASSPGWAGTSAAYVAGAAVSIPVALAVAYAFGSQLAEVIGGSGAHDSTRRWIDIGGIVLLLAAGVVVFRRRRDPDPPAWMGRLETARPWFAFALGASLLALFPSNLATLITVGAHLAANRHPIAYALPFALVTLLFLAVPALLVLIGGQRARRTLPHVRDWMNGNSWMISELVLAFFIVNLASGL